jgi:16S rRNA (guanine(966)-N(2))-methyltransferase RsmD
LGDRVKGAAVLDLFAGTGAMGLEALSRGGDSVVFVDAGPDAVRLIKNNLDLCNFSNRARVVRRDLLKELSFLRKLKPVNGFELIFVDPPYRKDIAVKIVKRLAKSALLSDDGVLVVEEASDIEMPDDIRGLNMIDRRLYGDTAIHLYENDPTGKPDE